MAELAELAFLGWKVSEERARQRNVVLARDYYDGDHKITLTKRQQEFLGFSDTGRFALNYCRTVVNAVWERLIVASLEGDDTLSKTAWGWWTANRMDGEQINVHKGATRDGEYFVIVDLDDDGEPRFTPHPRYTDPSENGTGFGCKAFYPPGFGRTRARMEFASKRWTETVINERGQRETHQRLTLYYPDRIEKYAAAIVGGMGGWVKHRDESDKFWPVPWVDAQGNPLGINVIHFINPRDGGELWDAVPIQDAISKAALDLIAAADNAGFPIRVAKGWTPTTDGKPPESGGGNYLKLTPGCWLEIPKDAMVDELSATELKGLADNLDAWIIRLAQVTDTPVSRFQMTRQIAAEGTQKQMEAPLLAKVRTSQTEFGNSWEDMFVMAGRLVGQEIKDGALSVQWKPAETRDEQHHIITLGLKRDKLNIPLVVLWAEAGYSPGQIDDMMDTEEYRGRVAQQQAAQINMRALMGTEDG